MKHLIAILSLAVLGTGCSVIPPQPLAHSPEFAPVYPQAKDRMPLATGAIYQGRASDNFFGRGRHYQVGDVITVLLNESTQAERTQNSTLSRKSTNDVVPLGIQNKMRTFPGMAGVNLLGGNIENKGAGTADQKASLEGSVAVTVIDVLANGNLVLRGEKQLALTEGTEIIQVAGVIRPEDVAPNNTVQSRRLANAQITYRGTGDLASATRPGWGTSTLLKLWPF
jgi:flagellar L-ring protein precursor FlgH